MVKRKIVWSENASKNLYEILDFYIRRNQSKTYSTKLYQDISKNIKLLKSYPYLGNKANVSPFRGLIVEHFLIIYEITDDFIIIHTIWDGRQNPENLEF